MIKTDLVDESLVSFRVEDLGVSEDLDAIVLLFQRAFIGQRASSASKQLVQLRWESNSLHLGKPNRLLNEQFLHMSLQVNVDS